MKSMNMLFIMSDQHSNKILGCHGHPLIKTPHMDRLAERGTRFTDAYTQSPICVPARATMATGRYVFDNKNWCNAHSYTGEIKGWGHRLQDAGHRVVSIGKLHYRNETDPTGFDEQIIPMHVVKGIGDLLDSIRDQVSLPVRHKGKTLSDRLGPGDSTYTKYDSDITEKTCEWLRNAATQQDDKPWCLFSSLVCPHPPFIAPQKFYDLYNPEEMPFDKGVGDENFKRHPWIEEQRNCQNFDQHFSNETRKIAIANYFGTTSFFDDNLGKILKVLEETGLDQNTRIVYTSDHGENLGKRGLWGKSNLYEEPAGHVCATPVSHIDCYQTIVEGVGLSLTDEDQSLPGQSMFGIASGTNNPERIVFAEYHAMAAATGSFMLRKGRYKLIYYVDYEPELFDLDINPEETINLALDPAHKDTLNNMEQELRNIADPEAVDREAKVSQDAIIEQHGGRDAIINQGGFGNTPAPGEKPVFASGP